jgi:Domain of unknown function (DUF4177)
MARLVQWEYSVVPIKTRIHSGSMGGEGKPTIEDVEKELNVLGKEGWELVCVQDTSTQDGRIFTIVYLKRQKITEPENAE